MIEHRYYIKHKKGGSDFESRKVAFSMYVDVNFKLPEELLLTLRESKEDFILEMKRATAVKYFINKKLSIGQCAELAEMNEVEFIKYLSSQNISIFNFDSEDDLLEDIKNA